MFGEVRQSVRLLIRAPATTLAAVTTLALAIGASTAVLSVVDQLLVRSLPIESPDRVLVIWPRDRANPTTIGEISFATFRSWQDEVRTFQTLAATGSVNWSLILQEGDPLTIPVAAVSASFFSVMGTPAALGRTLRAEDDALGAARVVVLSHRTWVSRFAADPAIVGRPLRFRDAVYTVVGVMPDGFDYPPGADVWVPLVPQLVDASARWDADVLTGPGWGVLFLLGRLAPGATIDAARDELSTLMARDAGTAFRPGAEAVLTPIEEHLFGATRPALLALALCVALVLLIGCANVAVLLVARASARAPGTAIRLAIGAGPWRIVRQASSEALLLALTGSVVGMGLAHWMVELIVRLAPPDVPRLDAVSIDARSVAFASAACLLATALAGLPPGILAARWTLPKVAGTGAAPGGARRLRRGFVVAQVGLAVALLVCAGLVGRSLLNLMRLDIGFEPAGVLTLDVTIPDASPERHNRFYTTLLARVSAMPGVQGAGAIFQRPLEHAGIGQDATILIEGQRLGPEFRDSERNPLVNLESVTPGYFLAAGTRIVRGRPFSERDIERAPRVAIVSERLAQRLWPGQNPIGRLILHPGGAPADEQGRPLWSTVVGVAEDARYRGIADVRYDLYVPYRQNPGVLVKHLMVRASGDPLALIDRIRAEARRLEAGVLVENVSTMDRIVARSMAPWRFGASTLGMLGALALALAATGVYATVSQSVVERTREVGVRIATGARPADVVGLFLREGLIPAHIGIAAGLALGTAAGRALRGLLYGLGPLDPATLAGMAALLAAVSTAAIAGPAWRAARVDPVRALRQP